MELEVKSQRLPSPSGFVSWRVDVETAGAEAIEVQAAVRFGSTVHSADITPRAPYDPGRPVVQDVGASIDRWTCSHTSTRDLVVSAPRAAAFRVEWTANGKTEQVVLPDHPKRLYQEAVEGQQRLELGHLNCLGESFPWLQDEVVATITTLYPNGSESPATPPIRLQNPATVSKE